MKTYFGDEFWDNIDTSKIEVGDKLHKYTADNPKAYFNGNEWVIKDYKTKRYDKSINKTAKYIRRFLN